jgi:hypothetical protein
MVGFLKRHKGGLLALGVFGLLTFLALDNLVLNFASASPGLDLDHKDYALIYWDMWWAKYALFNLHTNPMLTNYILFPNTANLALHTHIFTLGLLSAPFQAFIDLHWIVNGWVVAAFLLSSTLMFVFLRRHVNNLWLPILGAVIYAFSPGTLWRATEVHLHTLSLWWLPLSLLLWDVTLERRSVRWSVALGICIYFAFMHYSEIVLWLMLTLAPYMLYRLFTQPAPRARWQVAKLGLVAAVAACIPALVIPLPQVWSVDWKEYPWEDLRSVHYFSFPFEALFTRPEVGENNTLGQTLPALALISVALAGPRRERWLWLGTGIVGLILALGPYWGDPSRPLPFMLIYQFTHGQYRTPVRLTTPVTLSLVIFVIWSLANLFDRWRNPWVQALAVVTIIAIYCVDIGILEPFPIVKVPDYAVYHIIGRDKEDHTLLQVPIGPASGSLVIGGADQLAYYARFHHQRTINGLVSRLPANQLARFERTPFLRALARENPLPPFEEARAELVKRLSSWDIRYIVVHKDLLDEDEARAFIEFFNQQPELCVFDDAVDTIAYRAISAWIECPKPDLITLPSGGQLKLGESSSDRFVGQGWYNVENIGGPQGRWAGETVTSTLRLIPPPGSTRIRFRAVTYPANQTVTVSVNDYTVGVADLTNDWADYEFTVPAEAWHADGPSVITLVHARLESAFDRSGGVIDDKRPLAAAYDNFLFESAR